MKTTIIAGVMLLGVIPACTQTSELREVVNAVPYRAELHVRAVTPITTVLAGGALPKGLSLGSNGVISGTPELSEQQNFYFTVSVKDSSEPPQSLTFRYLIRGFRDADSAARYKSQHGPERDLGFDPATFVQIYEDTKTGGRVKIYSPKPRRRTGDHDIGTHLSVDTESSVVIVPDSGLLSGSDLTLNKLFMTAILSSGDKQQKVEVKGYSEIGKDQSSTDAQRGMAFQTVDNIQNMIVNMVYTSTDIIEYVSQAVNGYPSSTGGQTPSPTGQASTSTPQATGTENSIADAMKTISKVEAQEQQFEMQKAVVPAQNLAEPAAVSIARKAAGNRFLLYKPEIDAVGSFFANQQNLSIVRILGKEIFWVDSDSLQRIATQYQENMRILSDSNTSTADARNRALFQLLDRTMLILEDFGDLLLKVKNAETQAPCSSLDDQRTSKEAQDLKRNCAINEVAKLERQRAFAELTKLFAPGTISLRGAKASDGDLLTLTVEAIGADGNPVGIPAVFEIDVKKYGTKIQWSPSLLFVHRNGVTHAEAFPSAPSNPPSANTPTPINRVNFAPSPGMTFGVAWFKRGNTGWARFVRAMGPGIGMNVTFMNFNDPSYNLATNQFVNTNGTNVQIGAGTIGSLFDNKLQFSYGWNLNVDRRRSYVAVGFGFIEIGKEVAKYVPK